MKKTDIIAKLLSAEIKNKDILEVACGCADLSMSVARYAHSVSCIDINDNRLPDTLPPNVCFTLMDATQMSYSSNSFDIVILYNAFSHVYTQWDSVKYECMRVLKPSGVMYIIATWKLDVFLMSEIFCNNAVQNGNFLIAKFVK